MVIIAGRGMRVREDRGWAGMRGIEGMSETELVLEAGCREGSWTERKKCKGTV